MSTNNTRRYIDVSKLAQNMGQEMCGAIVGMHAFTGSEYTSSIIGGHCLRCINQVILNDLMKFINKPLSSSYNIRGIVPGGV